MTKKRGSSVWNALGETLANRSAGSLLRKHTQGDVARKDQLSRRDETGKSALHHAAIGGDLLRAQGLLKRAKAQSVLNDQDVNGWTPLHCALCFSHLSVARLLLSQPHIDVALTTHEGAAPMHYLARNGLLSEASALFDALLQKGGSVYARTHSSGEFPLHMAVWAGQASLIPKILKQHASPDLQNARGETLLHYAVLSGSLDTFSYLVSQGADPWIADYQGNLPIDLLRDRSDRDRSDRDIFAGVSRAYGAIAAGRAGDHCEEYPLHHAAYFGLTERAKELLGSEEAVATINDIDASGNTPLLYCAYRRRFDLLRLLLACPRADVTLANAAGCTLAHVVCRSRPFGSYEAALLTEVLKAISAHPSCGQNSVEKLFGKGNCRKETALHAAVSAGNAKAVSDLLSFGVPVGGLNHMGYSALDYSIIYGYKHIAEFLISMKCQVSIATLDIATRTGQTHFIEKATGALNSKASSTKTGKLLMRTNSVMRSSNDGRSISSSRSRFHGKHDFMLATTNPADDFFMLELLGRGAHAEVFKAKHKKTGDIVAIKRIQVTDEETRDLIKQEIIILEGCNHENIVRYHGCFFQAEEIWIVMDFCAGGSLLDIRKSFFTQGFSEDQLAAILYRILLGLQYLHSLCKIHRDMKSGNVLLTDDAEIKIADFGVSCQFDHLAKVCTTIGTPLFMSPEVINGAPYDSKADMWSLGITAIEMMEGKPPLFDEHILKAMLMITRDPPPTLAASAGHSQELVDFIHQCLQKDPALRPSAAQLLEHPFITRHAASHAKTLAPIAHRVMHERKHRQQVSEQEEHERSLLPAIDAYLSSLPDKSFPNSAALATAASDLERFRQSLASLGERVSQGRETAITAEQIESLRARLTVAEKALQKQVKSKRRSSKKITPSRPRSGVSSPVVPELSFPTTSTALASTPTHASATASAHSPPSSVQFHIPHSVSFSSSTSLSSSSSSSHPLLASHSPFSTQTPRDSPSPISPSQSPNEQSLLELKTLVLQLSSKFSQLEAENAALRKIIMEHINQCSSSSSSSK